jgi:hypothetical protein
LIKGDVRRPQQDSFNRLFGGENRANGGQKNLLKSNIPIGGPNDQLDAVKQTNGN